MSKRGQIVDFGSHKPLGSSWRSVDTAGYSRLYEPETRPEFRCYVTGQQAAMQQAYEDAQALALLNQMIADCDD